MFEPQPRNTISSRRSTRPATCMWAAWLWVLPLSVSLFVNVAVAQETQPASAPTSQPTSQTTSMPTSQPTSIPTDDLTIVLQQDSATSAPAAITNRMLGKIVMNFKDAPLQQVLQAMSESLGLVVINHVKATGRVNVFSRQPLDTEEAIDVLNTLLKINGHTALRTGKILRILTIEEARTANVPVRTGAKPEQIRFTDTMITQVIPLRFVEADKLRKDIESLLPKYANMTSNTSSNTLILTATESDVRHVVEIVQALDIHMSETAEVRVFQLEFADANDTAKLIKEVFDQSKQSSNQQQNRFPMMFGRRGGGQDNANPASSITQQRVVASADDTTNAVVVSAPPDLMPLIAEVIKKLDGNPTAEESIFVYPLRNATASNLETVLQNIFNENNTSSQSSRTNQATQFRGRGGMPGMPGMNGADSSATGSTDLAGKVYVVADETTNSLLVRTAPKYFDRVKSLIAELDRPTRQVLIKVLIAEITHSDDLDLGAEFSVLNLSIGSTDLGARTDFNVLESTRGVIVDYVSANFTATIRALEAVGKLDVLSRPYLLASENQEASITVGEEVPFVTDSRTTETSQTINTVEYRDIGIILNVTPYIGPDGRVILDVSQEISNQTGRTVTVSENFEAEVYAKRSAQTRVAVSNGRTVVIGGLMQDRITETVQKVPWFGDLPLVGAAFRRTVKEKAKTELLIFLSPQVALTPEELKAVTEKTKKEANLVKTAIEKGAYQKYVKTLDGAEPKPLEDTVPTPSQPLPIEAGPLP